MSKVNRKKARSIIIEMLFIKMTRGVRCLNKLSPLEKQSEQISELSLFPVCTKTLIFWCRLQQGSKLLISDLQRTHGKIEFTLQ